MPGGFKLLGDVLEVFDLVTGLEIVAVGEPALACLMPGLVLGAEWPAAAMTVGEQCPHGRMNA